jgi:ABC-2 type transport system permease protein
MRADRGGGFGGALRAEWRKLRRQPFPPIALLLALAATAASGWWAGHADHGFPVNGYFVFCTAARWGFEIAGLLVLLHAATAIAGEATAGTLKLVLVRPVGRGRFLLAKLVLLVALVLLAALVVTGAAWLLGLGLGGYGDVLEEGLGGGSIVRMEAARMGTKPHVAVALSTLCLLGFAALGLALSTVTNSSTTAVMVAVLVYLPMLTVLPYLAPDAALGDLVFVRHATRYLERAADFARGFDERWDAEYVRPGLVVPAANVLVLLAAALTIFHRKDISL